MILITEQLINKIDSIINNIELQYQCTKGLILTEDDVKCLIYSSLRNLFLNKHLKLNYEKLRTSRQQQIQPIIQW